MAMVCPQCSDAFEQRLECPRCDVRLVFQEHRGSPGRRIPTSRWQQTGWGRVLIGLILAQGLYHGVRHLTVAGLLAAQSVDLETLWSSLEGFLLLQAMQLMSLFLGGLLAGAGQRQGALYGMLLGVWNGVLLVMLQPFMAEQFNTFILYSLPLLQAAVGALAGWLGGRIWRPLTPISVGPLRKAAKPTRRERKNLFVGPVYWVRVVMGTGIAVGGALWAGVLLQYFVKLSDYSLSPASEAQARLVTWEIVAVAILAGGAFAGATTRNGLTQGLAVGIATSVILVGIRMAAPHAPSFLLLSLSMFGPIILAIVGGGFGSQLLPPVLVNRPRSFENA